MANVIWLLSGARLLREVRKACRMSQPQFAKALGEELGWTPPTGVVRAWEETNRDLPDEVDRAVRRGELVATIELSHVGGRIAESFSTVQRALVDWQS